MKSIRTRSVKITTVSRPAGGVRLAFVSDEHKNVHAVEVSGRVLGDKTLCGLSAQEIGDVSDANEDHEMCLTCLTASESWARGGAHNPGSA